VTPLWQQVGVPWISIGSSLDIKTHLQIVPESLACRLYILTVLVQTTIDLAIEGDLLMRFQQAVEQGDIAESATISSRKMPVYLSIFALAQYVLVLSRRSFADRSLSIFQFVMAVDAVYARNTLQFMCLTSVLRSLTNERSSPPPPFR
jgi:hypothetical protein